MMPPDLREAYEAQATACLEAAANYREQLLRAAVRLTGSEEAGRDLLNHTVLSCHDAIQGGGFVGDEYRFYILRSLRNECRKQEKAQRRQVPMDMQLLERIGHKEEEEAENGRGPFDSVHKVLAGLEHVDGQPGADAATQLAERIEVELRARFKPADRIAFRLHVAGFGCQDIADMIGRRDRTWVWRRLGRIKGELRRTFQQAWESLGS